MQGRRGSKLAEPGGKPVVRPERIYKFATYVVVKDQNGWVFAAKILSDTRIVSPARLTGKEKRWLAKQKGQRRLKEALKQRIISRRRLNERNQVRRMLRAPRKGAKVEYYRLRKMDWFDATQLPARRIKYAIKGKKPQPFSYGAALFSYERARKKSRDLSVKLVLVRPEFQPIGVSESLLRRKRVPKRKVRIARKKT